MFADLLKKYRNMRGFKQSELADKINELLGTDIKSVNVSSWEKGTNPKIEIIEAIADILDIPVQYLFDDSDQAINKIISNKAPQLKEIVEHTLRIPLIDGYVGAGSGGIIDALKINEYVYIDSSSVKRKYVNDTIIAIPVVGDSMTPYVNDDDIILFHPLKEITHKLNDGKYVIQNINGVMVKNLKFTCNGDIIISSCNKAYSDEIIKAGESQELLEILGIVVGRILKS
jgi:phage repressor protein C with HTH and peptisase S24 domain